MVMTIINIVALILIAVGYFKMRYMVVKLEVWNEVADYYNAHHDEDSEELIELPGGEGFFKEQIQEDEYEEDDE